MASNETLYLRFLESGLTVSGSVRRVGHVMPVPPSSTDYDILSLSEKEQRKKFGRAFYEHLTADEYDEVSGLPSVQGPELARRPQTPAPPGTDGEVTRGGGAQPAVTEPGHVPAAASAQWPWYDDSDVATTLGQVASMSEAEATQFLAHEQAHKARKGVLGPMTGN